MRRGFTLVELLIAMVVTAILGTALVRMLISDSRFVSRQDAMVNARATARAAMNAIVPELRMVTDSGLVAAAAESVVVRVPYAFGMACQSSGSATFASLVPSDSLAYATAVLSGLAWRTDSGAYTAVTGISVAGTSVTSYCDQDSIRQVPGGQLIQITPVTAVPSGNLFYLYQTVRYRFSASSEVPGAVGLWRKRGSDPYEEIVTPFDASARFAFLVGPNLVLSETPPGDLETVRGLELRLVGASETAPQGKTQPETFALVTRVPFMNRGN